MPPRKTTNQHRVAEEDELYQRIEQIIDSRLEVDPRRSRVPNPTADLEDVEYDSYSEGDATLFSEDDSSDDAFFVEGGDGEPEFNEEEDDNEGDDKGYDGNRKFDEFEGNDVSLFASTKYDDDNKETDVVWKAIDKRMD
ncbi:hypothetical protein CDL15_Pgr000908 [Punica granatum]|uniref:PRP1 splicing factor N-terminal domain-containing protein n=1 Tax=Punica granatum TaxID=22663 RepID=A0A218XI36_PUNGR|nr:hypothetical protein CDL15_Pgr000908 [Punica granatum]PKI66098.1 hypothetical protein CRG98_013506 [Punica granatum]